MERLRAYSVQSSSAIAYFLFFERRMGTRLTVNFEIFRKYPHFEKMVSLKSFGNLRDN